VVCPAVIRRSPVDIAEEGKVTGVRYPELPTVEVLAGAEGVNVVFEMEEFGKVVELEM